MVLLFFVLFPSLDSKPSLFLLVCFCFLWCFGVCVFFMGWFLFVCLVLWFENKTNLSILKYVFVYFKCLSSFLLSLPFPLLLFFFPSLFSFLLFVAFLSLGLSLLPCFFASVHEMNNFNILNYKGFFHQCFLFLVSEGSPHLTLA